MLGTFVTDGAVLLVGLLTGGLVARFLLPDGRGALAAVLFWPQLLAGIGLMSLGEAATYRMGTRPQRAPLIRASCFWLALALSCATMLVGYLLVPLLLGEGRAHLWSLARLYLLYVPFNFVALGLLGADQGQLRFTRFNTLRSLVPLVYLTGILALWATDRVSVGWCVAANGAASVLLTLLCVVLQGGSIRGRPSWGEAKALLGLALRFHPATVLLLLAGQADLFAVLTLGDDSAVGLYVIALTMATSGLSIVSGAYHKVLFPHVALARDASAGIALLTRGVRHATVLLVVLSAPLVLLMPWLVPAIFGVAFRDAVGPAWVLSAAYIVVALKVIIIQGLRGLGEGRLGSLTAAVSLVLFLLIAWPLGKLFGLVGLATALGLANLGALVFLGQSLRKRFGVNLRDLWGLSPRTMNELWQALARLNPFMVKQA
jgi:O-antigen/teichoic acid export membrane protein